MRRNSWDDVRSLRFAISLSRLACAAGTLAATITVSAPLPFVRFICRPFYQNAVNAVNYFFMGSNPYCVLMFGGLRCQPLKQRHFMGKHRPETTLVGAHMDRSYDSALTALAKRVGLTKSDLIRRALVEFIANTNKLTDWRQFIVRDDEIFKR